MADDDVPKRFRRYPYGPGGFRIVTPCIAILAGIVVALRNVGGLGTGDRDATVLFIVGAALIPFGVLFLLIARWMAKRGL